MYAVSGSRNAGGYDVTFRVPWSAGTASPSGAVITGNLVAGSESPGDSYSFSSDKALLSLLQ
ncbi:hypothetical protein Asru_0047_01 [Acidisphaera rubrifaciens HS-AP3]|uniref:Uncharacterized protein n=1 Tax=Acidisphaera rubrifaciens HS-AP3 TaxID=1231350 RepID=A0A0D6P4C8_9PROT|nr:hypothetical protein Asru_0047_01 [Acidisphaera rubrifaciens HS-AP3]